MPIRPGYSVDERPSKISKKNENIGDETFQKSEKIMRPKGGGKGGAKGPGSWSGKGGGKRGLNSLAEVFAGILQTPQAQQESDAS